MHWFNFPDLCVSSYNNSLKICLWYQQVPECHRSANLPLTWLIMATMPHKFLWSWINDMEPRPCQGKTWTASLRRCGRAVIQPTAVSIYNTPLRSRTPLAIAGVNAVLKGDWRCTLEDIVEKIGLSHGTVQRITLEDLNLVGGSPAFWRTTRRKSYSTTVWHF